MTKLIKDLVQVPEVKTIVQLSDIEEPELRDFLTESFLLTDEVKGILTSIFHDMENKKGKGYFIKGNFGSGKSHLLSVLSLLLSYKKSWQPIVEQLSDNSKLNRLSTKIKNDDYIVLNISLVEHSNREYLEDIVIDKINKFLMANDLDYEFDYAGEEEFTNKIKEIVKKDYPNKLQSFLRENKIDSEELFSGDNIYLVEKLLSRLNLPYRFNYNRQDIFSRLKQLLKETNYNGIVILIDELSEFLRSKPDGRRFNEDIRFLQFLGEYTAKVPCWVAATLQEEIEKTGENTPEAFNKIKDRYPARYNLSGTHIKEIISHRLLRKKEGAEFEIEKLYRNYQRAFQDWSVGKEEFISLYPVHPLSVELLTNLKPLFSQHRGIIDFIHYRIRGSESRQIEGIMDKAATTLLTPDYIFDHFCERIREMMETNPYYEKVYRYYEQEIESILNEDEVKTGLRLVKLLILFAISPLEKKYSVKDMAHMLLEQITDLESEVNYDYIADIMDRLYHHGAYLVRDEGENRFKTTYHLDLQADVNLIIKRKREYIKSNLFADDRRLFAKLAEKVDSSALPLKKLCKRPKRKKSINWQNTEREGFVYLISFTEISLENIKDTAQRFLKEEEDFMLLIAEAHKIEEQREYLQEVLLSELNDREREAFLFWLPKKIAEKDFLKDALSRILLLEEYSDDSSSTAREIKKILQENIRADREKINDIFRKSYYNGTVVDGHYQEIIASDSKSFFSFDDFLQEVVANLLSNRFPDHKKIQPYSQVLSNRHVDLLIDKFLLPGEINNLKEVDGRVLNIIDSFLKPMGLIKKKKNSISLKINPDKNKLIRRFFALMDEEKTDISNIYLKLRKGSYGLSRKQFRLLVYSLLYSGYLTAYSNKQKISLKRLNGRNFSRLKYLGYGEIISEDFQKILADCALLPPRYKNQPFSLPLQQEIWNYLTDKKREMQAKIDRLKDRVKKLEKEEGDFLSTEKMMNSMQNLEELLSEIMVSYSSEEGLERFASEYRTRKNVETDLEQLQVIEDFINNNLSDFRYIKNYLTDSKLKIPEEVKYSKLNSKYEKLLNSLQNEFLVFSEDYFIELTEEFSSFQEKYIEIYRNEHQRQLAADRFQPYRSIKNGRSYNLLSKLSRLQIISVSDDLIKVDRKLSKALQKQCSNFSISRLKNRPVCSCGFTLGQKIELPSRKGIEKTIKSGIIQYLENLNQRKHREKIEKYLENMEAAGEKRFARPLRNLLKLSENPDRNDLLDRLEKLVNRRVINTLNRALSSDISIVERDVDELYENLLGRSFSPEQLQKLFDEWLKGKSGISSKTYIKVYSESENGVNREDIDKDEGFHSYLKKYYPELLPLADFAGQESFSLLLALLNWEERIAFPRKKRTEVLNKIFPEKGNEIIKRITNDQSLLESAEELSRIVFKNRDENDFQPGKMVERILREDNLLDEIVALVSADSISDWLEIIRREEVADVMTEKLVISFAREVESSNNLEDEVKNSGYQEIIRQIRDEIKRNDNFTGSEKKRKLLDFTVKYLQLKINRDSLQHREYPETASEWKDIYVNHLSDLELLLTGVENLANQLALSSEFPLSVIRKVTKELHKGYNEEFRKFYESSQFMVAESSAQSSADKENMIYDLRYLLNEKYTELLKNMGNKKGICLLLDGMRWDIWKLVREKIVDNLAVRKVNEDSLFALLPTNTERQLTALHKSTFNGEIINSEDVDLDNYLKKKRKKNEKIGHIIKFSYIDDKVHTSKDDYQSFVEEVIFHTENRLIPFLAKLGEGVPIFVFADHGFRLNYAFKKEEKYESPRYLHGGSSSEEVVVPWSLLYKI